MGRIHLFELEDQPWFPSILRDAGMAYLRLGAERLRQADNIRPVIEEALARSGETEILDLCSGGGGPAVAIAKALHRAGHDVSVTLTDLYPSPGAVAQLAAVDDPRVRYQTSPMDAADVPTERPGLRTIFNAFHHLRPAQARRVLASAVAGGHGIAVVEVLKRGWLAQLAMLFAPVIALLVVPFLRPFRWGWLPLTYLIPVIPLFVLWDGSVSIRRAYDRDELMALVREADPDQRFDWTVTDVSMSPSPLPGMALVGIPRRP